MMKLHMLGIEAGGKNYSVQSVVAVQLHLQ